MDESRKYNAKQNKPVRERQIPYDFTHVWNLRNKRKQTKKKKNKKTNQKTENKLMVTRGEMSGEMGKVSERIKSTLTMMSPGLYRIVESP